MTILILGGAGYIGSHTVKAILDSGYEAIVIDNLVTGHKAAVDKRAKFYEGDIRDKKFLDEVFRKEKIDAIVHFAAYSLVGESVENPLKYYDNNLLGTKTLLEAMVENKINNIVFSSTAATYGEPKKMPITESDMTEPTNPYGETKLAMEKMFKWCEKAYGVKYVSLRYFNACGADESGIIGEDHEPETHLIPVILKNAINNNSVKIFGTDYPTSDGTCVRDYIHVTDLASAHVLAVKYLLEGGKSDIFNLGNGVGFSVREVIETAKKVMGKEIEAIEAPRRAGDPATLVASSEKIKNVLGWNPSHDSLEEIIYSAWNWHKNNPDGYKD